MAKRAFNPAALAAFADVDIRPPIGEGALVWRFSIFVPLEEQPFAGADPIVLADSEDLESLQSLLERQFSGLSVLHPLIDLGRRDPGDPTSVELNKNLPFAIYSKPITAADRFFEVLQQELQDAYEQGHVLIERQEVFLLGQYRPTTPKVIAQHGEDQPLK